MALLRPGRWGSRRKGGCPRHRTKAQRQPKGQHAGGTPALPGKARPAAPCGSFEGKRPIVSEDEPPMDTKRYGAASTARSAQNASAVWCPCACKGDVVELLERPQFSSRERGRPARTMMASRERGRPARTKPGTASAISSTWINRKRRHGSPSAWPLLFSPAGWLPVASHRSSAAAKGTACGRDARAPGQGRPGGAVGIIRGKTADR